MKGQIVKIVSNLYTVNCGGTFYDCHSRGKFRNDNVTPVVGDYVVIDEAPAMKIAESFNAQN